MSPAQIVERVDAEGGFGFLAHPFSQGSERFKRGGEGMPWRDLDADGYTGHRAVELRDRLRRARQQRAASCSRSSPAGPLHRPSAAAQPRRVGPALRAPPVRRARRRRRTPDRDPGGRPRAAAPDGLQALASGTCARTCWWRAPLSRDVDADRDAVFGALRAGHAYIAVDSLAPARGFRFWAEASERAGDGRRVDGRVRGRCVSRRPPRRGCDCCATARRWRPRTATRSSMRPASPGVYRVEAYRHAARSRAHVDPVEPDLPAVNASPLVRHQSHRAPRSEPPRKPALFHLSVKLEFSR